MLNPLAPGRWDRAKAAHLLNRAGFGGSPAQVATVLQAGLATSVRTLVDGPASPVTAAPPPWAKPQDLQARREGMQDIAALSADPVTRKQIEQQFRKDVRRSEIGQIRDLGVWWLQRMRTSPDPLQEKLTLFWHGHFATSVQKVRDAYYMWRQNDTLRRFARGQFGALVKAISRDPAMIIWLDLRDSRPAHPNENFARELMELFTLGEGHYTEGDVGAAARAFTGYRLNPRDQTFRQAPRETDAGEKKIFGQTGPFNGDAVIDLILQKPECANLLARKLWEFFAYQDPEPELVNRLAEVVRVCDYEMRPVLMKIFSSEEFFSERAVRTQIKSPVQWIVQNARIFETDYPPPYVLYFAMRQLGQVLFNPPSVKGWDGGKAWISTSTLLARYNLAGLLVESNAQQYMVGIQKAVRDLGFDPMNDAAPSVRMPDSGPLDVARIAPAALRADVGKLVDALSLRLFQTTLTGRSRDAFVEFLQSKSQPADDEAVRGLLHLMMSTPQFQLC
jgi:uncharacterized protein (DUF1800 family)